MDVKVKPRSAARDSAQPAEHTAGPKGPHSCIRAQTRPLWSVVRELCSRGLPTAKGRELCGWGQRKGAQEDWTRVQSLGLPGLE